MLTRMSCILYDYDSADPSCGASTFQLSTLSLFLLRLSFCGASTLQLITSSVGHQRSNWSLRHCSCREGSPGSPARPTCCEAHQEAHQDLYAVRLARKPARPTCIMLISAPRCIYANKLLYDYDSADPSCGASTFQLITSSPFLLWLSFCGVSTFQLITSSCGASTFQLITSSLFLLWRLTRKPSKTYMLWGSPGSPARPIVVSITTLLLRIF